MKIVIVESPFAPSDTADTIEHIHYARACVKDALMCGEAPLASHLLYTQPGILDDTVPAERAAGIEAGVEMYNHAKKCVVYTDYGISKGMKYGIKRAEEKGVEVIYRNLSQKALRIVKETAEEKRADNKKLEMPVEDIRGKLWAEAWIATANSDNCVKSSTATKYADTLLAEYDRRFKS